MGLGTTKDMQDHEKWPPSYHPFHNSFYLKFILQILDKVEHDNRNCQG